MFQPSLLPSVLLSIDPKTFESSVFLQNFHHLWFWSRLDLVFTLGLDLNSLFIGDLTVSDHMWIVFITVFQEIPARKRYSSMFSVNIRLSHSHHFSTMLVTICPFFQIQMTSWASLIIMLIYSGHGRPDAAIGDLERTCRGLERSRTCCIQSYLLHTTVK